MSWLDDYLHQIEATFTLLQIFRILGLVQFPLSRLICFIILRNKVKNNEKFKARHCRDVVLSFLRVFFMVSAIIVATLSFVLKEQISFSQIDVEPRLILILACVGAAIVTSGCILLYYATFTLVKAAKQQDLPNLVSWGPFRIMRHPMHGSFLFFVVGAIALRLNWLFVSLMFMSWICGVLALRSEEEKLVAKYRDDYIRYKQQVGAFLPCTAFDCGIPIDEAYFIAMNGDIRSPLIADSILGIN